MIPSRFYSCLNAQDKDIVDDARITMQRYLDQHELQKCYKSLKEYVIIITGLLDIQERIRSAQESLAVNYRDSVHLCQLEVVRFPCHVLPPTFSLMEEKIGDRTQLLSTLCYARTLVEIAMYIYKERFNCCISKQIIIQTADDEIIER